MKVAVVLFNLGSPDSREAIEPFLMNFFMDKNIIQLPLPLRWGLAKMISKRRSRREAGESYAELGYSSPLLENSLKQAEALEKELNKGKDDEHKVFVCMRYWSPMAEPVVREVKDYAPDKIVLLPLYPQYSTTTTKSSFEAWETECRKQKLDVPTSKIESYPEMEGFIQASVDNILDVYKQQEGDLPRLLFSAHGLPEKIIKAGDPYQEQCERTVQKIVDKLDSPDLEWAMCYQSRIGRLKWIGPTVEEELQRAAKDNVSVMIYPHSFTQEHIETLVEIDIQYRKMAQDLGIVGFEKINTVGSHKFFISGLAELVG